MLCGRNPSLRCCAPGLCKTAPGGGDLHQCGRTKRLAEDIERLVSVQDADRFLHCRDFLEAALRAGFELLICGGALPLKVGEELLVQGQLRARVAEFLSLLSGLLPEVRHVGVELHHLLLAGRNLVALCCSEGLVVLLRLKLRLLLFAEIALELLLHLLQDAENLAALGPVALEAWDRQEGRSALGVLQEVPQHLHSESAERPRRAHQIGHPGALQHAGGELDLRERRVVLAEDDDCLLARLHRLDEVHLLAMEGLVLLHPQRRRVLEGLLVRLDLVPRRRALCLQLLHLSCVGAHGRLELSDLGCAQLDGLCLLLVVRLAPAGQLPMDRLVIIELSLQLCFHVLQQADDFHHRSFAEVGGHLPSH
mmetsp:Transcript_116205/g.328778  ORF Transcript_116205/g.328778 Transcript_116205/m.328778 type:complete len:366 (-) Transcript_116205:208-1305(-)